ncbi:MAG: hypothetical protein RLZZ495_86 [Pseudomonadota bacterium]|jgi:cell division protein ZapA
MTKQIDFKIMGQTYVLGCPDDQEKRLRDTVARVDAAMCDIRDAGKVRGSERIAVMAALNLTFEFNQQKAAAESAQADVDNVITSLLAQLDHALASTRRQQS